MRLRLLLATVMLAVLAMVAPAANAAQPGGSVTQAVTGTVANGGSFAGNLDITKFTKQGGQLAAIGTLTGTLTDSLGNVIGTVTNVPVTIPVAASGSCQVLHLELGPLDLNLLGLQVHLDKVVLDITAQQAPGNLLGNLLCAVAHLLDNSGNPLGGITAILNQILGLLGGL